MFIDGSSYEGQVTECIKNQKKMKCMHGLGVYRNQTGSRYQGIFKNNKPNGYGLYTSENGQSYKGNFKMGSLSGEGIMIYPDGRRYEGNFKENEHNGFGRGRGSEIKNITALAGRRISKINITASPAREPAREVQKTERLCWKKHDALRLGVPPSRLPGLEIGANPFENQ